MADKGIIIDVGFRGEYKKFIDEIEREFANIDFGKSLGMEKSFAEQEKKIRERLNSLKKLMDEVLAGNPSDVPKQLGQLQSSVLHLSKAVKEMMQNADPSDVKKFGGSISTITNDINELTTSCQNAQDVIKDLGKNHPVKLVDEGQNKELVNEYRSLKKISEEVEEINKAYAKVDGKKIDIFDFDDLLPQKMGRALKDWKVLNDKIKEVQDDLSKSEKERTELLDSYTSEALSKLIEVNRLYKTAFDFNSEAANKIRPAGTSKGYITAWIKSTDKFFDEYKEYIENRKTEIAKTYQELTSTDIADYFTKSEAKNEYIKVPISLEDGAKSKLKSQAIEIIDDLCEELANHPIEIEIVPVSNWANRQTQNKLNYFIKKLNELKNTPISENLANDINAYFDDWNKNIDNRFLFNIAFQTDSANKQLKEFIKEAQEELNVLNTLELKPDVVITDPVKEHVKTEIEELGKGLNLKPTINIAPEVIEKIKNGVAEEVEEKKEKSSKTKDVTEKRKHETEAQYKARMQALAILKGEVLLQDDELNKVNNVIDAVNRKTDAFISERDFTVLATQDEIDALSLLFDKVNSIRDAVLEINTALAGLPKEIELHLNLDGLNAESAEILDKVNQVRGDILHKTVEKYGESATLSEEDKQALLKDISDLTEKMSDIFDTNPIMTWENEFGFASDNVKENINGIFNDFQTGFDNVKIQINEISESFKSILGNNNPVSNELSQMIEDWAEADKQLALYFNDNPIRYKQKNGEIRIEEGTKDKSLTDMRLLERQTGFNRKTGYVYNKYLYGENGRSPYKNRILSNTDGKVNGLIHSHHEAFPSLSVADIGNLYIKALDDIEEDLVAGIYQVQRVKTKQFATDYEELFGNKDLSSKFLTRLREEKNKFEYKNEANYTISDYFKDMFSRIDYKNIFPELKNLEIDDIVKEISFIAKLFTENESGGPRDLSELILGKQRDVSEYLQAFLKSKGIDEENVDYKLLTHHENIKRNVFTMMLQKHMPELVEKVSTELGVPIKNFAEYVEEMTISEFKERYGDIKSNESVMSSLFNSTALKEFKTTLEQILDDIREIINIIPPNGIDFNISNINSVNEVDAVKSELLERRKILEQELRELEGAIDEAEVSGKKKRSTNNNDERIASIRAEISDIDTKLQQLDAYGKEAQEDLDFSRTTEGIDEAINSLDNLNTKFEEILETINILTEALRDNLSEMSDYGKVFPLDDLANAFYEYKKFFDADDLNSEAGAKAALKYLSAYKNALYSKVNKKDIKEYTIGGTDKYFTGNYKKYSGKNGSIKDLDLSGIESEVTKYKQVLLDSTGIPTLLDFFKDELQGMFSLPENEGELPNFLETIKSSLTMPEGANTVSDALNTLKKSLDSLTNSKVDDKITRLFETLDKIIERIQSLSGTQELPFIQNLNDILSKTNELKDLVKILESSAKQINAAKKNVKSEENYKKATELLSDNRQGIINAVMGEIGLPLDSDDLLGSEMKALKNGLVEVNTLIREADGTATQYTFTVDENLKAVNTKINDNVVDLKKYIDAIEKAEKEANIGKNNLGSYYEAFTPDSKGWDQLVDRIEKAGHKLESVDKIIRHIDEAGQESFQVFSGDTRVTVGMDSQQPLYRKDTVMDAAGALDTYKREIVDLKRVAEKAFAGDQVAIEGFISKYNELIGLYKTIEGYKAKGIISDDSFAEIESLFSSLKEKVFTFKDSLNFDKQMPEIQKQAEDIGKWFDKIFEKFNISSNGIDKDEFKKFIGQFTGILGTKNDSNIKAGNVNKLTVLLTRITEDMKQNSNMSNELRTDYERLERTIQSFNGVATDAQIKDLNAQFLALHYNLVQTGKSGKKFIDTVAQRLSDMNAKWIAQLFSIHDWVNYIRSTANAIIELDTALVDLKKTTTMTSEELDQFYFDANKIAKQMGVTTAEIISQASAWSRFNKIDLLYGNV